jgi:hypothetical protein
MLIKKSERKRLRCGRGVTINWILKKWSQRGAKWMDFTRRGC